MRRDLIALGVLVYVLILGTLYCLDRGVYVPRHRLLREAIAK